MTVDSTSNPYESPEHPVLLDDPAAKKIGPVAFFGIIVASLVAAWCTFFGTCLSVAIVSTDVFGFRLAEASSFATVVAILAAGIAGLLVARFLYLRWNRPKQRTNVQSAGEEHTK